MLLTTRGSWRATLIDLSKGLIINGYATNSTHGVVFIRQGHEIPIDATRHAIDQAYEHGSIGRKHI